MRGSGVDIGHPDLDEVAGGIVLYPCYEGEVTVQVEIWVERVSLCCIGGVRRYDRVDVNSNVTVTWILIIGR